MDRVAPHSLDKPELFDAFASQASKYNHALQFPDSLDASSSPIARTLKAVYPHFSQSRKRNPEDVQMLAMDEIKKDFHGMRDIQKQLNLVYQQLIAVSS